MRINLVAIAAACVLSLAACGKGGEGTSTSGPAATAGQALPGGVDTKNAEGAAAAPEKTASGIGTPASAQAPAPLTQEQLALAMQAAGMKLEPDGMAMNACEEKVKPEVHVAELGGAIGRAYLIVMGGGPNNVTCYGDGPAFWLMKTEGESFKLIFQDRYFLAIMPTEHKGVKDIAVGGPGFEFPVYEWNGTEYVPSRKIKDTEFPTPLN